MTTRRLATVAAAIEAATGIALIATPPVVSRLLLNESVAGVGLAISRVAGFALVALAIAAWPPAGASSASGRPLLGLLAYNVLACVYLLYLGVRSERMGLLLWPAVALHLVIATLLARARMLAPAAGAPPN